MPKYTEPSYAKRIEIVQEMYRENDEMKDYVERCCRTENRSIDEFLLTRQAYQYADWLRTRY